MKRRVACVLLATLLSCGVEVDPNGVWSARDAGVYFYDWDGGLYWNVHEFYLENAQILLLKDCRSLTVRNGRLSSTSSYYPGTPVGQRTALMVPMQIEVDDREVDQGYRNRNWRDERPVGLVRLSFDAGFHFETEDRAVFRWRADYSDDVKHLSTEGGEVWVERAGTECR